VASINALQQPGDFCVMPRDEAQGIFEIAFLLPAHAGPSGIIVRRVENVVQAPQAAAHVWNWDGNTERPTVNPEIHSTDGQREWRGWLIAGAFVTTPK